MTNTNQTLEKLFYGEAYSTAEVYELAQLSELCHLKKMASQLQRQYKGNVITYSAKVIVPLTRFCNEGWDYCTLANPPRNIQKIYLSEAEIMQIAQQGVQAGCHEILFFLAAKPENWSDMAKQELAEMGYQSTLSYLAAIANIVFEQTGLLPKFHSGVVTRDEISMLRKSSVAQGLMLDSRAEYICDEGKTDYGTAASHPHIRLGVAAAAGALQVPFTSGIVIGIGESRQERLSTLLALKEINDTYGHIQEIVIQDYRGSATLGKYSLSKSMLEELEWTTAIARLLFGGSANIQVPANLPAPALSRLLQSGINDWGSVSPATINLVGKGAGWPQVKTLERVTAEQGMDLARRLPLYPDYCANLNKWSNSHFHHALRNTQP